jgi:hypothetical protein
MFVSWRRINRQDAVYGYASRTLVNAFLSDRRRRRGRELLTGWLPERPDLAAVAAPEVGSVAGLSLVHCGATSGSELEELDAARAYLSGPPSVTISALMFLACDRKPA